MTDFGTDVSTFPDLDVTFSLISGPQVVGEAVARRLLTPRGALFYAPNYGFDLRALLNSSFSPAQYPLVAAAIEKECLKDERVQKADVLVTANAALRTFSVQIVLQTGTGPFRFVLGVGATSFSYEAAA